MRNVRLWRGLLGVDKRTVIEGIEFDEEETEGAQLVVARVRPRRMSHSRIALEAPKRWVIYGSHFDGHVRRLIVFVHGFLGKAVATERLPLSSVHYSSAS